MVCRCRRAEQGHASRVLFRYQATIHRSVSCSASSGLRQGRSATWRCGAHPYPLGGPCPVYVPFLVRGCSFGLGCLWSCSVTRPRPCPRLHLWTLSLIVLHRHWRALSSMVPVILQARIGLRAFTASLLDSSIILLSIPLWVWLRHSLQVFTVSCSNRTWAQCILLPSLHHQVLDSDCRHPFLVDSRLSSSLFCGPSSVNPSHLFSLLPSLCGIASLLET